MNKTAIVTGGTSGIGAGVSHALAQDGWQVIAAGVSQSEIDAFDARDNIELRVLDVTDPDSVEGLFSGLNRLDALVNCAGVLRRSAEYDIDVFSHVINVNLTGTMRQGVPTLDY